jgi:hypothetical protein
MLYNMQAYLEAKTKTNSFAKDYASVVLDQMGRRFPDCGTQNDLYCCGHILHPYYRGSLFRKGSERWKDRY